MNGIASHKGIVSVSVAVAAVLFGLASLSSAEAKQYKGPAVDIRVAGKNITGYEVEVRGKCIGGEKNPLGGSQGKAFGNTDAFSKKIRSNGSFRIKVAFSQYSLLSRGKRYSFLLRGRVYDGAIRGGYSIKTVSDGDGIIDTCWTGKSRNDSYVKFVAKRR